MVGCDSLWSICASPFLRGADSLTQKTLVQTKILRLFFILLYYYAKEIVKEVLERVRRNERREGHHDLSPILLLAVATVTDRFLLVDNDPFSSR